MRKKHLFQNGQTILLREIWHDRVWSARPEIVVQDKPELMAFYIPSGTLWKQPTAADGSRALAQTRYRADWLLKEVEWTGMGRLRMTIPGSYYSVLIFRNTDGSVRQWYINLEDPLRRMETGFDYIDQMLDITAVPNFATWQWKDADEVEEAIGLGIITSEKAAGMRVEGEKVINWLQSGKSPFNGWEKWRPNPTWEVPVLPAGWDTISALEG